MEIEKRIVKPGKNGYLIGEEGEILVPPATWAFLPAGDAGITRKVTSKGKYWKVEVKMGKRTISKGIWAPANTITEAQNLVSVVRLTDEYKKKRISDINRREKKQGQYETEFCEAVEIYLNFHPSYRTIAQKLAELVTAHAIPVGSGTVARTQMIPIEERASHAVIAWMRHQTTAYDNLRIARVKGERSAVRRSLAQQSVALLANYREGKPIASNCPLYAALKNTL